jgi:hypothetical protein
MGLLDRIGAFERYKVSPTQGTSGLLTGAGRPMSPFAQQAARQIGGALGMDMRTGQERLTQALAQVDPNSPDAEAQQLAALVKFGTPAQQVQATQRLTALREKKEAKSKEERQLDGYNSIATLARTSSADPEFLNNVSRIAGELRLDPVKVNELIKANTKGIKTETISDGQDLVRVNADGTTTVLYSNPKDPTPSDIKAAAEAKQEELGAEALKSYLPLYRLTEAEQEAIIANIDGKTIKTTEQLFKSIGKYDTRALDISEATVKELSKYQEAQAKAGVSAETAGSLINRIEQQDDLGAGAPATVRESLRAIFGTRDAASEARTEFNRVVNEGLIAGLPPGVASDKDIALLQKGFPPEGASRQEMLNYLTAYKRTLDSAKTYNSFKSQYISNNNSIQNLERDAERYRKSSRDASTAITGIMGGNAGGTPYNSVQPIEVQQAQRIEALVENFNSKISENLGSEYTDDFVTPAMLDAIRGNPEIEQHYSPSFRRNYLSN